MPLLMGEISRRADDQPAAAAAATGGLCHSRPTGRTQLGLTWPGLGQVERGQARLRLRWPRLGSS